MALVNQLRDMVAAGTAEYTAGTGTYWTDSQLQAALNSRRAYNQGAPVQFTHRISNGTILYDTGLITVPGRIEPGTANTDPCGFVQTSAGSAISGVTLTEDGWASFATDQAGISAHFWGYSYDLNAAAADVLDQWASAVKLHYKVTTDNESFERDQKIAHLHGMAQVYRRRALPGQIQIVKSDDQPGMPHIPGMVPDWQHRHGY